MLRGQDIQTQTVTVAPDVDRSGAVLVLGLGLFGVTFVFGNGGDLVSYLRGQTKTIPAINWGGPALTLLAVFLLLLLARTGEVGGNFAVLFLAAAWVVWLLNNPNSVATLLGQSSSTSGSSSSKSSSSNNSSSSKGSTTA